MTERPTIRDVAARAGVSVATVSYVMNDKGGVGDRTRERVRAAAAALGYAPDAAARSLATRRTRLIGIVVGNGCGHPDLTVTFFGKADAPQPGAARGPKLSHRFDGAIVVGAAVVGIPLGLALFVGVYRIANGDTELVKLPAWWVLTLVPAASALAVALVSALPARRAASLNVIEALHYE